MAAGIITLDNVHFRYAGAERDALAGLDLAVAPGETVAVVGPNGSGKSTLARLLGGLSRPSAGREATVCGCDLLSAEGRLAARREVGVLFQNPDNQLVAEHVEEDVAFGLENLAWPPEQIRARTDEMLERFDLEGLRRREPHLLSGGQKQRTALAGVLAIPRQVLVLDEPTAMLDAEGRDDLLDAVHRLRAGGLTIVIVTQEMDEVGIADRVVALEQGSVEFDGPSDELFVQTGLVRRLRLGLPPAGEVALALAARGRVLRRLPLTLAALAEEYESGGAGEGDQLWLEVETAGETPSPGGDAADAGRAGEAPAAEKQAPPVPPRPGMRLSCESVSFAYDEGGTPVPALRDVSFAVDAGAAVALLGPSGSGKSTLLQVLRGLLEPGEGRVVLDGATGRDEEAVRRREVGLVFQTPELQLFASTAAQDVAFGPQRLGWPPEAVEAAVEAAMDVVGVPRATFGERHPYSLSGGEQRRLALAGVLAMQPRALLLDEPFVNLDPGARRDLVAVLARLAERGTTVILATHDEDAAWQLCREVLVLDGGRLVAAGRWGAPGGVAVDTRPLRPPFLVELWRRLGRDVAAAPRSAAEAAEALA
jgi:energy-coupling factor transport system ATP-binding protein